MIFDLKNEVDIDLVNRVIQGKVVGLTSDYRGGILKRKIPEKN